MKKIIEWLRNLIEDDIKALQVSVVFVAIGVIANTLSIIVLTLKG